MLVYEKKGKNKKKERSSFNLGKLWEYKERSNYCDSSHVRFGVDIHRPLWPCQHFIEIKLGIGKHSQVKLHGTIYACMVQSMVRYNLYRIT